MHAPLTWGYICSLAAKSVLLSYVFGEFLSDEEVLLGHILSIFTVNMTQNFCESLILFGSATDFELPVNYDRCLNLEFNKILLLLPMHTGKISNTCLDGGKEALS